MRIFTFCMLAAVLILLCPPLAAQQTPFGAFYYPARYPAGDKQLDISVLTDEIRQKFVAAGRPLPLVDRGLSFAAAGRARHLAGLSPEERKREAARDVKSWLLEYGIGDDRSLAGFASAATLEKLTAIFGQWAEGRSRGGWTHMGAGVEKVGNGFVAVLILSYRSIDPAPIPRFTSLRRNLIVDGIVRNNSDFLFFLAHPDGSVFMRKPMRIASGAISCEFKLLRKGMYTLQLVELGASGPVPVATMPIEVEKNSKTWIPSLEPFRTVEASDMKSAYLNWINRLRVEYQLAPLAADPRLDEVAARLAAEMASGGSFAHESNAEGPRDRIERSGVRFVRFGENLAHGPKAEDIVLKLWNSPSHRYNMLDGGFNACGTGVAVNENGQWFLVQLFAEIYDPRLK